jgi:hypothetical protein
MPGVAQLSSSSLDPPRLATVPQCTLDTAARLSGTTVYCWLTVDPVLRGTDGVWRPPKDTMYGMICHTQAADIASLIPASILTDS